MDVTKVITAVKDPKTWGQIVNEIGILGIIVLFLVYMGANTLPALGQELQVVKALVETHDRQQNAVLAEQQRAVLIMRQMCASLAKLADRSDAECFR